MVDDQANAGLAGNASPSPSFTRSLPLESETGGLGLELVNIVNVVNVVNVPGVAKARSRVMSGPVLRIKRDHAVPLGAKLAGVF